MARDEKTLWTKHDFEFTVDDVIKVFAMERDNEMNFAFREFADQVEKDIEYIKGISLEEPPQRLRYTQGKCRCAIAIEQAILTMR